MFLDCTITATVMVVLLSLVNFLALCGDVTDVRVDALCDEGFAELWRPCKIRHERVPLGNQKMMVGLLFVAVACEKH